MGETDSLKGVSPALALALTLRFLLELALLVGVGVGVGVLAWSLAPGWSSWPAAILAIAVVATVWGLFLSPKARVPLPQPAAVAIEAVLFVGTGAGLIGLGFGVAAVVGIALWAIDRIALAFLGTRRGGRIEERPR